MALEAGHRIPEHVFQNASCITPVPLHCFRYLTRGFNQAHHLCRGLLPHLPQTVAFVPNLLIRKKNTKTQTKLDYHQRHRNLINAFTLAPEAEKIITRKICILVDDVVTTGATVEVCSQLLKEYGAASVRVLCLART